MSEPPVLSRRRLLGGAGASLASVLAACSHRGSRPVRPAIGTGRTSTTTTTSTTTSLPDPAAQLDVVILRTASSIEHYAVGIYTEASGLDAMSAGEALHALRYFADQHSQHAAAFEQATTRAGGTPFTEPNRQLSAQGSAQLAALRSQGDVLKFAYGTEALAAATYAANAAQLSTPVLSALATSIGAVDARHLTILGLHLVGTSEATSAPPFPAAGFQLLDGALPPGTGI